MKGQSYNVKNIFQLLKSRGFINHVLYEVNNKTHTLLEYGVPGTFLRHNIQKKWWQMMLEEQSNAFPIEHKLVCLENFHSLFSDQKQSKRGYYGEFGATDLKEHKNSYLNVLKLANERLPFSVVSSNQYINTRDGNTHDNSDNEGREFFLCGLVKTQLLSQSFVPPSGFNRVFDFWLQQRLSWWKKYSKNPSRFNVSSSPNNKLEVQDGNNQSSNGNSQVMSIDYEFPWGSESVELIQNYGDTFFRNASENGGISYEARTTGGKKCIPVCIQCITNIERIMATFLVDAFHERKAFPKSKKVSKLNPILQLHPQLAPFQAAICLSSNEAVNANELLHICAKLEQDMFKSGISIFNASKHVGTQEAHFKRNDQLGIPYTLILNDKTLQDGIISMRCRDTEVKKPVHVSKAVEEISRNVMASLEGGSVS